MPPANQFRHQSYSASEPRSEYRIVHTKRSPPLGSDQSLEQMAVAGERLAFRGVSAMYLVHGTLAGTDVSGIQVSWGESSLIGRKYCDSGKNGWSMIWLAIGATADDDFARDAEGWSQRETGETDRRSPLSVGRSESSFRPSRRSRAVAE